MLKPPDFGPRPGCDSERTPVALHAKPSPVVVRSGDRPPGPPPMPGRGGPRAPTPLGGTLAPFGRMAVPDPEAFATEEPPTPPRASIPAMAARLVRNWAACSPEDQRLIEALAVRLRPGVGD